MENEYKCAGCQKPIPKVVNDYSMKKYGKSLCRNCQEQVTKQPVTRNQETKTTKKHTITLQGKEFVTHEGLLQTAHDKGLKSITTERQEIIGAQEAHVFKAKVVMKDDSTFEAYGDASKDNVNSMIAKHIMRMAETRAINRALRLATNIGMTSAEELGDEKTEEEKNGNQTPSRNEKTLSRT